LQIARALCLRLHSLIEPYYVKISPRTTCFSFESDSAPSKGAKDIESEKDRMEDFTPTQLKLDIPKDLLTGVIFPLLKHLHLHISKDVVLFAKICRLLKAQYNSVSHKSVLFCSLFVLTEANSKKKKKGIEVPIREEIEKVIEKVLLPGLSLIPANPGISSELWELIKVFPYTTRYRLYGYWKNISYAKHPDLMLAKAAAVSETKKLMRSVAIVH
jgi:THO complex subunit 2